MNREQTEACMDDLLEQWEEAEAKLRGLERMREAAWRHHGNLQKACEEALVARNRIGGLYAYLEAKLKKVFFGFCGD